MKYQIFGPNGNKVCIVEALNSCPSDNYIGFYDSIDCNAMAVFTIPDTWAAIPLEFIEKD